MNKDQIKGKVEEAKGKVKEVAGKILDDKGMEIEGNVQKNVGKVQKGFGDLKEDIKERRLKQALLSRAAESRQTGLLHGSNEILTNTFLQEINMKLTNMKLTGLVAVIVLTFCSFGVYAEESKDTTPHEQRSSRRPSR